MDRIKAILFTDTPVTEKAISEGVVQDQRYVDSSSDNLNADEKKLGPQAVVSRVKSEDFLSEQLSNQIAEDEYADIAVEDDSAYPEVRAAVPSVDDPTLPQNTVRLWVLGMLMATVGSALNLLFSLHSPSIHLSAFVTSILAWPMGKAWDKIVPNVRLFGRFGGPYLNPSPFNLKEHCLIQIMANVSFGGGEAYATDIFLAMNNYFGADFGWGFDMVTVLATQCVGFALAGIAKDVLITPGSMIWPSNLVTCTFLTNLHINENHEANGWKISRLKFFFVVFVVGFVYYWFPGFIFQALSYFAWVTWIKPDNVIINQVFGASTGLGIIPLTFDWNQIAGYVGSPLVPPVGTIFSILLSMVLIFWITVPAVHYSNVWFGKYLPISDSGSYDRFQQSYNVTKIVSSDLTFDIKAYESYSPLYLPATFAISYGMSFASNAATLVHAALFHGKDIIGAFKQVKNEKGDVHNRLMKEYKDVPHWWYAIVFLIFFGLAIASVRAWNTEMPVWALVFALIIASVFLIPIGIIAAVTSISVGLNVLTEFIIGYILPGKPIAMMFFKTYGYITNYQAVTYAQDMKLGHYMKIAPRLMFKAQFIATVWSSIVQVCVLKWAQGNITDVCDAHQKSHFTCPNARVFFNAAIIWGVIGPQRMFSPGQMYNKVLWFFLVGAILPLISWVVLKKWPRSPIKYLNWPVFFSGTGLIPPATPYNYGSYCFTGIIFGYFIKKKWFHWWTKYNYSLSAALDIGLAWSSLMIFFCLVLSNTDAPNWWGNNVIETSDYQGTAIQRTLSAGESFGLTKW
ncbi:unnamed protein product [Kluyveromyces dobzhanskii CBS 2104]|uniref:WGS project CCBQ000000000 data, contig 00104 n=1 Tax=Kluyveromyces dobzhanskii CBS 2104 TaxID=1427455 RepID=A0A0A8L3T1_9SACH|nr:unnamed protein product [Kluyveromyces dobzhanskii CBS 2104]